MRLVNKISSSSISQATLQILINAPNVKTFKEDSSFLKENANKIKGINSYLINKYKLQEKIPYTCYCLFDNEIDSLIHIFNKYTLEEITDNDLFFQAINSAIIFNLSLSKKYLQQEHDLSSPSVTNQQEIKFIQIYNSFLQQYIYRLKEKTSTTVDHADLDWINNLYKVITYYHSFVNVYKNTSTKELITLKKLTKEYISIILELLTNRSCTFANVYRGYRGHMHHKYLHSMNEYDLLQTHIYIVIPTILQLLTEASSLTETDIETLTDTDTSMFMRTNSLIGTSSLMETSPLIQKNPLIGSNPLIESLIKTSNLIDSWVGLSSSSASTTSFSSSTTEKTTSLATSVILTDNITLTETETVTDTNNTDINNLEQINTEKINLCKWLDQILTFNPKDNDKVSSSNKDIEDCKDTNCKQLSMIKADLLTLLKQYPAIYDLYQSVRSLNLIT